MTCSNEKYHQALQSLRDTIDLALNQFDAEVHESLGSYSPLNEDTDNNVSAVPGFEVVTGPGLYPENITINTDGNDSTVTITPDQDLDPYANYSVVTNNDDVITFGSPSDEAVSF